MSHLTQDPEVRAQLRADLEALGSIQRAFLDGEPPELFLICDKEELEPAEPLARAALVQHGFPEETPVHVAYAPMAEPRRRVRFLSARLTSPRPGRATAEVELEWAGQTYTEEMEGESGSAVELRLAALATVRSLEAILGSRMKFELVGIKGLRAFDTEVVVALLNSPQASGRSLVGAALATDNLYRSAALAVLNATNRVLGNYLSQS
jgi:hypothetical protein